MLSRAISSILHVYKSINLILSYMVSSSQFVALFKKESTDTCWYQCKSNKLEEVGMWFRKYQLGSRFSTFVQIHMLDGHNTLHSTTNTNDSQIFYIMKNKNLTWILVLVSVPPSTWQAYTEKTSAEKKANFPIPIFPKFSTQACIFQ